jgi:hypothetical protein
LTTSWQPSPEVVESVVCNTEHFFSPQSQLPSNIQFENAVESVEHEKFIQDHAVSSEPIHNRLQKISFICNDPVGNYMDDLCVPNSHPLDGCQFEDRIDKVLIWQSTLLHFKSTVSSYSSQRLQEVLQPYHDSFRLKLQESTDVGKVLKSGYENHLEQRSNVLDGLEINMYSYEDPFAAFLRSAGGLMLFNFIKIQSVCKFLLELSSSRVSIFLMSKHLQRIQSADKMLTWLHWIFDIT